MNVIEQKISRLEREVTRKHGDALERALERAHHDVKQAIVLKIRILNAQQAEQPVLLQEIPPERREWMAQMVKAENATYRKIGREAYLAALPTLFTCGKCGATVGLEIERAMRHDSELPRCGCVSNAIANSLLVSGSV